MRGSFTVLVETGSHWSDSTAYGAGTFGYSVLFFVIGAMMNGVTIGYLGFLVEISPDDRRPACVAWFSVFAAPAALSPLLGAALVSIIALEAVFVAAILAALTQIMVVRQLSASGPGHKS